jgi:hypothetical protein
MIILLWDLPPLRDYLDIPEGNPAIPEELLRKSFWINYIKRCI